MRPEQKQKIKQAATLHLVGKDSINCLIIKISDRTLSIQPDNHSAADSQPFKQLRKGDLAELHIDNPVSQDHSSLIIRSTIDIVSSARIVLVYNNPDEHSVRQLLNWFSDSPLSSNSPLTLQLKQLSSQKLQEFLDNYLLELEQQLLKLADNANSNEQQHSVMAALTQIHQHSGSIKENIANTVNDKVEALQPENSTLHSAPDPEPTPVNNSETTEDSMELIDLGEFEDWLSLETIIRRTDDQHHTAIKCLEKRYSHMLKREIKRDDLPFSVRNLCNALKTALKQYDITPELMPLLYRIFDETVIQEMSGTYDELNSRLKHHGILPNIEADILSQAAERRSAPSHNNPGHNNPDHNSPDHTDTMGTVEQLHPVSHSEAGLNPVSAQNQQALYSTVQSILQLARANTTAPAINTGSTELIHATELIEQLSSIQHDPSAVASIGAGSSLGDIVCQQSGKNVSANASEVLNLVSSFFNQIDSYQQLSVSIIQQLKRLQVPLAKTALLDEAFLSNGEHPARQLINQLTDLSLNSEMPNPALENKFENIIDNIIDNYDQDASVYQQGLASLDSIAKQQSAVFTRNTQRINQTYEGRQRLKQSQDLVEKEIIARLPPPQQADIIVNFIDNGWRELLQFTYLKDGPESKNWQQQLNTLDQLSQWINNSEKDPQGLLIQQDVNRELETDSFLDLLEQQLNTTLPGDYRHEKTVASIRNCLEGSTPVKLIDVSYETRSDGSTESTSPELNRWFKRARSVVVGDEFSYLDDESEQRNIKLAWVGDNHQHFVFVNNRGQKVLDFNLLEFCNELAQGLSPTEEKSEWPLVEKSLYSTVQQAYEQLAFKSSHDELTGLINRKECDRLLGAAISDAKQNKHCHYLLYLDIDKFALSNDLYGHVAGDQFIADISQLIVAAVPEQATVARMAGNEFVILLENHPPADAHQLADAIRQSIEQHKFKWEKHSLQLTTSIGTIAINENTEDVINLLRNVISSCKSAKDAGGNRCLEFSQSDADSTRRETLLSWIDKLNDQTSSDHLYLRAQKIVAAQPKYRSAHYEILLGVKNPDGSISPPVEFIEAAEHYNQMQRVDRWVIENTFIWLQQQRQAGHTLPHVSINLSANSINDDHLADFLIQQMQCYAIPSNHICFEITETATIANIATAADFIREIKQLGCQFSLDDFGSGNASYQYLKHLPVDYIKIDGSFVQDIHNNKDDYAMVKSIQQIASLMEKKTIAEYAENDQIITILKEIGVDFLQGYGIAKPVPLEEIDLGSR